MGPEPRSRCAAAIFEQLTGHEQVVFCHDEPTGLRAIIAIHSTALGPALGGTRFYPYADDGGRARRRPRTSPRRCPTRPRSPGSTSAAARRSSSATRATAEDRGAAARLRPVRRVAARPLLHRLRRRHLQRGHGRRSPASATSSPAARVAHGGAGDSSVLTAFGVFQGMRAAAEHDLGRADAAGRTVGVAGVGKVGRHLVEHLVEDGADVVVTDVTRGRRPACGARTRRSRSSAEHRRAGRRPTRRLRALRARRRPRRRRRRGPAGPRRLRRGQQPAGPPRRRQAAGRRGILYAPDYVVNAGGLIQVADELEGFSFERARRAARRHLRHDLEVFGIADGGRRTPGGRRGPARRAADRRGRPAARIWLG